MEYCSIQTFLSVPMSGRTMQPERWQEMSGSLFLG
jgi:hypothetical protein